MLRRQFPIKILARSLKHKVKNVVEESYLVKDVNTKPHLVNNLGDLVAQSEVYSGKTIHEKSPDQPLIPVSPLLGPIEVLRPKIGKKYHWCACGMSLRQPFCDGSHKATDFEPKVFVIEEPVFSVQLCGCKLTSSPPFCDSKTCKTAAEASRTVDHESN